MRRIVTLFLALALSFGIVQVAFAGPLVLGKAPLIKPFGLGIVEPSLLRQSLIKYLNLTDEQISKVKELRAKYYEKLKDLYTKLQDAIFSLRQLQLDRQPDKTQIDKKREEINNIRKEINKTLNEYWKEFKEILTKEQLSKLADRRYTPPFRVKRFPWRHAPFFRR